MLHSFFDWVQNHWGEHATAYGRSYSAALLESLNAWGVLEGTHLLTVMLFFGTILIVDLRLLGVTFTGLPVSTISRRLLPLTVFSLVVLYATGALLFFSKPEFYFHNIWFRLKLVVLAAAMLNIAAFHVVAQRDQDAWDEARRPPGKARASAVVSLASWFVVIGCGRFIAYHWFECGKPQAHWMNLAEDCKASSLGVAEIGRAR